jgi:hypothetical protein
MRAQEKLQEAKKDLQSVLHADIVQSSLPTNRLESHMKITIEGYIHATPSYDGKKVYYSINSSDMSAYGYQCLGKQFFDVDVDAIDPVALQIRLLQEKQKKAAKEFADLTRTTNEQIAKLQALTNDVEVKS